ncbi:MAG TPA: hypothetical protein VFS21_35470 [Roseiflexaceae bacterium]|nr:hypothetical protein [Roseiflexaceae bacterium]
MITRTLPWWLLLAATLAAVLTVLLIGRHAATVLAQTTLSCPVNTPVVLEGRGPAGAALLLRFNDRVVGGGQVGRDGRYRLILHVGEERATLHSVVVARRDTGEEVGSYLCLVGVAGVAGPTQIPPTSTPAIATQAPPPTTPAATATPAPTSAPLAQVVAPTLTAPAALAGVQVVELPPAVTPALEAAPTPQATTLTVRASYDRNQNKTGDVDEGIAGLTVVVSNAGGQLLGQALTDATGAAELTVRALPGERLTVAIPSFAVAQAVAAGAQPQPVVISRVAPLPALLP